MVSKARIAFVAFILVSVLQPSAVLAQAIKPNIVHIYVDDLSWGLVGFNGSPIVKTPNLDQMATQSLTFSRAYAASICSPSRGMLYTGFHMGHAINDENVENFRDEDIMVGELLKTAGYDTAIFGKWGFGGNKGTNTDGNGVGNMYLNPSIGSVQTLPTSHGYDHFVGYLNHTRAHRYFVDPLWKSDSSAANGVSHYPTGNNAGDDETNLFANYTDDIHATEALNFLTNQASSASPFYLQMNFNAPHSTYDGVTFLDYDFAGNPRAWDAGYQGMGLSQKQKELAVMISRMDEQVGALLARIRDPNQDGNDEDSMIENTIVMFTSDNGGDFNAGLTRQDWEGLGANGPFRGGKRDLYEGGIRVPMIVMWEGTTQVGTTDQIVDLTDFMATAAELAGIQKPVGIDGVSFAPLLSNMPVLRKRRHHVWEHHEWDGPDPDGRHHKWAVIRDNVKLIYFENGDFELYDLGVDPSESSPLDLNANAQLVDELVQIANDEGITLPVDGYAARHVSWMGEDGESLQAADNWLNYHSQIPFWVATVANDSANAKVAKTTSMEVLGMEVGGASLQTIRVNEGATLEGRNEVRINAGGRIQLDAGQLETARWIDVHDQGFLTGHGQIQGDVYSWGNVEPGLPADLPGLPDAPEDVDTGTVPGIEFDFTGTQDQSPLEATSTLDQYSLLTTGLSFGPGVEPRGAANAGDEFNVMQWNTVSMANAITNDDYIFYSITPTRGIELKLEEVSFRVWRNGVNAAKEYAIFSSHAGFSEGSEIAKFGPFEADDGDPNDGSDLIGIQHAALLTGTNVGNEWSRDTVEVRFYGWATGGTNSFGNTHVNQVLASCSFRSVPGGTVEIDSTGKLELAGDYYQLGDSTLCLELGGLSNSNSNDPEFDQLVVNGYAQLGGKLKVTLVDDFEVTVGQSFEIVVAENLIGEFDELELPALDDPCLSWTVSYEDGIVRLTAGDGNTYPTDFETANTEVAAGDLTQVCASDDEKLELAPARRKSKNTATITLDAVSPTATPASFSFTFECHGGNPVYAVDQEISLMNYQTGEFEVFDLQRLTQRNDVNVVVNATGDLSRFVDANNGNAIQAKIFWEKVSLNLLAVGVPLQTEIDRAMWTISE